MVTSMNKDTVDLQASVSTSISFERDTENDLQFGIEAGYTSNSFFCKMFRRKIFRSKLVEPDSVQTMDGCK